LTGQTDVNHSTGGVRPLSDEEVGHFRANGWALLSGLVAPDLCAAMRAEGERRLSGLAPGDPRPRYQPDDLPVSLAVAQGRGFGTVCGEGAWMEWRGAVRDAQDPLFCSVALNPQMGKNVQRLLSRDRPMRVFHDIFACKLGNSVSAPTHYHQDATHLPLDRNSLTVWIALDDVRPDQGLVRFYTQSHRHGLLGRSGVDALGDLREEYPELAELAMSPEYTMKAGDCTVHHGLTVHGSGPNTTTDPRWSYLVTYFPGDARYTGVPSHDADGFGLEFGRALDHPSFCRVPE
jgi:hypothetical protein